MSIKYISVPRGVTASPLASPLTTLSSSGRIVRILSTKSCRNWGNRMRSTANAMASITKTDARILVRFPDVCTVSPSATSAAIVSPPSGVSSGMVSASLSGISSGFASSKNEGISSAGSSGSAFSPWSIKYWSSRAAVSPTTREGSSKDMVILSYALSGISPAKASSSLTSSEKIIFSSAGFSRKNIFWQRVHRTQTPSPSMSNSSNR